MELSLKPSRTKVREYYNALNRFGQLNISHERWDSKETVPRNE